MHKLRILLLLCIFITACSKDEPETDSPEQEETTDEQGDIPDDSEDNMLIVNTASSYLSNSDRSFIFLTVPSNNVVGDFIEISNSSSSTLEFPANPTNAEYDLHLVYVSKNFFNEDNLFVYTYKNFNLSTITLFRDDFETNDCNSTQGTATVHFNSLPAHTSYIESESNCENKDNNFESPFTMSTVTVNGSNPSYYLSVKNQSTASYVEIDNLNINEDYFISSSDFNSDMSENTITVAENVSSLTTELVNSSNLHFGTLGFQNKIKGSNPITSPVQLFLPNISNRLYKSTAVYDDSSMQGGFYTQQNTAYDIHSSSGNFDTSEINSEISIADINDLDNLNISKSGNAIVAYGMTAYNLVSQNGTNYLSDLLVFVTTSAKSQFKVEFPEIPAELLLLYPDLKMSNLGNTEKFNVGVDHEQYLEASDYSDYLDHFFMSDGLNNRFNWISGRKRKFEVEITRQSTNNLVDFQQNYFKFPPISTFK